MIRVKTGNPEIHRLLAGHPLVSSIDEAKTQGLTFQDGSHRREVRVGDPSAEEYGLLELMDNNPIVCANSVSVPSAAGTLALIAIGPLAASGLLADQPTLVLNVPADEADVAEALATEQWAYGAVVHVEPQELGTVAVATAITAIQSPESLDEIDDLYAERYGRSFFVFREEDRPWDASLVSGSPRAAYRLAIVPDDPHSLLTIRVLADLNGKCGAAQVVHAMNIMCGYEETLGIA